MSSHAQAIAPDRIAAAGSPVYRTADSSDVRAAAARWLDAEFGERPLPPLLVVIGLAGGELLDEIDRRGSGTRVLAIEPDPVAAEAFLARHDLIAWRSSGRLKYLAAPDFTGAEDAWRIFPAEDGAYRLVTHPRLIGGREALNAAKVAKTIVFGVKANAEARRKFAPRYLLNVIRNVPAIAAGRDVRALSGSCAGVPALITAAGPSLDNAMEHLHDLHARSLLIATDTTLRPLLGAGIAPHIVVGADPGAANARHFRELPRCERTWLVGESALDATAADVFGDRTFWFRLSNHHPWPWLTGQSLQIGQLEMWGSVLTAAFQVAYLAGCNPIVIVGADLAFTDGRPYCRGTTYEFDWAYWTAMGMELPQAWQTQMSRSQLQTVADLRGEPTTTTRALLSFRDWMLAHAKRSGRRVINATGRGMLFGDGIEQMSLETALSGAARTRIDLSVHRTPGTVNRSALAGALRATAQQVAAGRCDASPATEWRQFSGEGFDPAAVARAAAACAEALESGRPHHDATNVIPWESVERDGTTSRILSRLAEANVEPRHWTSRDTSPLLDALRILGRISDAVRALHSVDVVDEAARRRSQSSAVLFAWPEQIRWAIQLFEALIGSQQVGPHQDGQLRLNAPPANEPVALQAVPPMQVCLRLAIAWLRRAAACKSATCNGWDTIASLESVEKLLSLVSQRNQSETCLTLIATSNTAKVATELWLPLDPEAVASAQGKTMNPDGRWVELGRFDSAGLAISVRRSRRGSGTE